MPDFYTPVSNVEPQLNLALDIRDLSQLLAAPNNNRPVDWAAVKSIYENGRNSRKSDGSFRNLASIATNPEVLERFPKGAEVLGNPNFLDVMVRDAIDGTGRSQKLSDGARAQIVDKSILAIIYGEVLEELNTARAKLRERQIEDASGAPHNMDEAWAYYVGVKDNLGNRSYSLSSMARKRERDFDLEGKIDVPAQRAMGEALEASKKGYVGTFLSAIDLARGYLNTAFYLGTLRYVSRVVADTDPALRQVHLAEGWGFFQTIRPAVASISVEAAKTVEATYERPASKPVPQRDINRVYNALNDPKVLKGLLIPKEVVVLEPR